MDSERDIGKPETRTVFWEAREEARWICQQFRRNSCLIDRIHVTTRIVLREKKL